MGKTFFDGYTDGKDRITMTRTSQRLQLGIVVYKQSVNCPQGEREKPMLPGWADIVLTRDEVIVLRDLCNRFIAQETDDCSSEGNFEEPMTRKEYRAVMDKVKDAEPYPHSIAGKWWDVLDGHGLPFNTVRALSAEHALKVSSEQAYRIGIRGRRDNPPGAYAQLTPSEGKHPF